MKPEDFGVPMIEQAHRLRHAALMRSAGYELDPKTTTWLIPLKERPRLLMECEMHHSYLNFDRSTLMGIQIRWTADDQPGTPELQLVMEPILVDRKRLKA